MQKAMGDLVLVRRSAAWVAAAGPARRHGVVPRGALYHLVAGVRQVRGQEEPHRLRGVAAAQQLVAVSAGAR